MLIDTSQVGTIKSVPSSAMGTPTATQNAIRHCRKSASAITTNTKPC